MLRGYRGIILAVGLILSSPSHSQNDKSHQTKPDSDATGQLQPTASSVEEQPIATAPDGGCKPGEDDRQSDLCAQWKAADAAAESARWTFWTLIAGITALAIGGGTLFAAWRAAHWAKKAADHTADSVTEAKRSANEAEKAAYAALETLAETREANQIARDFGRSQLRPYVAITAPEEGDSAPFSRETILELHIRNFGQIPASNVRFFIAEAYRTEPIGDFIVPLSEKFGDYGLLAPNDIRREKIHTKYLTPNEIANIASGPEKLLMRIRVEYVWPGGDDFHDMTLILDDPSKNTWNLLDHQRRHKQPGFK